MITAIRMPASFDGVELVRRLREDERTKEKPVIVRTACAFDPDQSRAFSAGCDVFLPKPCLPESLVGETERLPFTLASEIKKEPACGWTSDAFRPGRV